MSYYIFFCLLPSAPPLNQHLRHHSPPPLSFEPTPPPTPFRNFSFLPFVLSLLYQIFLSSSLSLSLSLSVVSLLSCVSMTSNNFHSLTPLWSSFPIDLNEDHFHNEQLLFNSSKSPVETSSLSYPIFVNPSQEGGGWHNQQEAKIYVWHEESYDNPKLKRENDEGMKLSICKKEDRNENQSENSSSAKWVSSKMRLMKKMINSDQAVTDEPKPFTPKFDQDHDGNNNNNSPTNAVRVCSDCNTTKTPLWRSGPRGPKSLCNACGIRQRKARRAMAAAAVAAASTNSAQIINGDTQTVKSTNKVQHNKGKKNNNSHLPFKKRCKFTAHQGRGRSKKFGFEDLTIILSKNSAFHQRVFPQDEKEAAILLMALSHGLVHG